MNLKALNELAKCAPLIFGHGLPMEPNPIPTSWDGRRADHLTTEMREALSALEVLCALYHQPTTKLSACVLYFVFVRHGVASRADSQFLARMALTLTPPAKPPKLPLTGDKLRKWQTKGFGMFHNATQLWARTVPAGVRIRTPETKEPHGIHPA